MRIAFMGTPDFAVPTLQRLVADGHDVAMVYTQPPRRAGRGKTVTSTPVQQAAEALGLPLRVPATLKDEGEQDIIRALALDAAVVAAYGLILPRAILEAPRIGCLNVHASVLPRWRGAAPIQRAILAGDVETGVTIMDMEAGLDTGPMRLVRTIAIEGADAGTVTERLALVGAEAMAEVLSDMNAYLGRPQPNDGATYAAKIDKHEARIDFGQSAETVDRQIRAFAPVPGAFFEHAGERIRMLSATIVDEVGRIGSVLDDRLTIGCRVNAIRPLRVQRAGRGVMDTADLLRGFPLTVGTLLS